MTWYLVLLRGIHDVPGNRRHGETVVASNSKPTRLSTRAAATA
jgi:hypothetical protein